MTQYRLSIHIVPRRGILDPQGKAVTDALHSLGFSEVGDVRVGRYLVVELQAASAEAAQTMARSMCEKLLANPVTEDFEIAAVNPS